MIFRIPILPIMGMFFMVQAMLFPAGVCAEIKVGLEPAADIEASPAFQAILKSKAGTTIFEIRKIEYLLERISRSTCTFIRNGKEHKGETAAFHMRWKYARYKHEIKTGSDFVLKVADG